MAGAMLGMARPVRTAMKASRWRFLRAINPFVLPVPRVDAAITDRLLQEYLRRQGGLGYSGLAGAALVLLIGVSLEHGLLVLLSTGMLLLYALDRRGMRRLHERLARGRTATRAVRALVPVYVGLGIAWALVAWPAYLAPSGLSQDALLVAISLVALVMGVTSVCFAPRLFTAHTAGYMATTALVVFKIGATTGLVLALAIPVLQYMLWDMARHYHRTWSHMLFMQLQRDRALAEQAQVITVLDDSRRRASQAAATDGTTRLPNRNAFVAHVDALIDAAVPFRLLLVDLDYFKNVNDTLGHHAGDALLRHAGTILGSGGAGEGGQEVFVARLGGDEFAVVIPESVEPGLLAERHAGWLRAMSEITLPDIGRVAGSFTCGVAHWPEHARDRRGLMQAADMALRMAKTECRGSLKHFQPGIQAAFGRETRIAHLLADTIEQRLYELHLQPQVSIVDGRLLGAEVLTRFLHPELSKFPVQLVFEVAEQRGIGQRLSKVLLDDTLEAVIRLQPELPPDTHVAINLSPSILKHPVGLIEQLWSGIDRGLRPDMVTLEVTEDAISGRGVGQVREVLESMASMGFRLALDDFGTGQSAFSHLHSLPIHEVKIAKEFVDGVVGGIKDEAIVKSVLTLCRHVGLRCVLEGVETEKQSRHLATLGADIGQGFYWARPMPITAFRHWLDQTLRRAG